MSNRFLDDREAEVAARLKAGELRGHVDACASVAAVLGRTLHLVGGEKPWDEVPIAARVGLNLLVRLHNDLRCTLNAALSGYPLQAAGIIASAFEAAFALAYVGDSEERGRQWAEHPDLDRRPRGFNRIDELVDAVLRKELPADEAERSIALEYGIYRQLCAPKHVNPRLQRGFGIVDTPGGGIEIRTGPDERDDATRISWMALDRGIRLVQIAVGTLAHHHLSEEARASLRPRLDAVQAQRSELGRRAEERGWAIPAREALREENSDGT